MTTHAQLEYYATQFLELGIGIVSSIGVLDVLALVVGVLIIPLLALVLGGRLGLRGLVFTAVLWPLNRWVGFEHGNEYTFHPARSTDRDDEYEALIDGEWVRFTNESSRWSKFQGLPFGVFWDKRQDTLEASKDPGTKRWIKDDHYVIDASKEVGVLREAEDPGNLDRVREDVLTKEGGKGSVSPLYMMLFRIGALVVGSLTGLAVIWIA